MSALERWVRFWSRHEHPRALAIIRILVGTLLLYDVLSILCLDLVVPMFGVEDVGGLGHPFHAEEIPLFYRLAPPTEGAAYLLFGLLAISALTLTLGLVTRASALVLLLGLGQFADINPAANRGVDLLACNVLLILVFAKAGACFSLDARRKTGSWLGLHQHVPAWPRYLLMLQVVILYFTAGIQKVGLLWTPFGDFGALYVVLQDPAIARSDFSWLSRQPWYLCTQVATAATVVFQLSYPSMLWLYRSSGTNQRKGWRRLWARRHVKLVYLLVGIGFHIALAITTELGIFPFMVLALYPALLRPEEMARLAASIQRIVHRLSWSPLQARAEK